MEFVKKDCLHGILVAKMQFRVTVWNSPLQGTVGTNFVLCVLI